MNRPLFPTTLLILSYDIGKYVGLWTYQHPLVQIQLAMTCNKNEQPDAKNNAEL